MLKNRSLSPIAVERHLIDALSVESVSHDGKRLEPSTAEYMPMVSDEDHSDIGILAPGAEVSTELRGLTFVTTNANANLHTKTKFSTIQPGRYEVVVRYAVAGHAGQNCFRGPLSTAATIVEVTPAR